MVNRSIKDENDDLDKMLALLNKYKNNLEEDTEKIQKDLDDVLADVAIDPCA